MARGAGTRRATRTFQSEGFEMLKHSSRTDREQRRAQIKLDRALWKLQQIHTLILQLARK